MACKHDITKIVITKELWTIFGPKYGGKWSVGLTANTLLIEIDIYHIVHV